MNEGETKLLGVPAKSARERREKREERRERREERRESLSLPLRTCVLLLSSWFRLVRALSAVFPSLFGACPSLVWVCVLLRHAATPLRRFPFLHRLRVCFRGAMNATVMQNLKFDSILGFSDIYNYIYIFHRFCACDPGIRNYCFQKKVLTCRSQRAGGYRDIDGYSIATDVTTSGTQVDATKRNC